VPLRHCPTRIPPTSNPLTALRMGPGRSESNDYPVTVALEDTPITHQATAPIAPTSPLAWLCGHDWLAGACRRRPSRCCAVWCHSTLGSIAPARRAARVVTDDAGQLSAAFLAARWGWMGGLGGIAGRPSGGRRGGRASAAGVRETSRNRRSCLGSSLPRARGTPGQPRSARAWVVSAQHRDLVTKHQGLDVLVHRSGRAAPASSERARAPGIRVEEP
jgi:hypothetical protein